MLKALGIEDGTLTDEQIAAKRLEDANKARDEKVAAMGAKLEASERARERADAIKVTLGRYAVSLK